MTRGEGRPWGNFPGSGGCEIAWPIPKEHQARTPSWDRPAHPLQTSRLTPAIDKTAGSRMNGRWLQISGQSVEGRILVAASGQFMKQRQRRAGQARGRWRRRPATGQSGTHGHEVGSQLLPGRSLRRLPARSGDASPTFRTMYGAAPPPTARHPPHRRRGAARFHALHPANCWWGRSTLPAGWARQQHRTTPRHESYSALRQRITRHDNEGLISALLRLSGCHPPAASAGHTDQGLPPPRRRRRVASATRRLAPWLFGLPGLHYWDITRKLVGPAARWAGGAGIATCLKHIFEGRAGPLLRRWTAIRTQAWRNPPSTGAPRRFAPDGRPRCPPWSLPYLPGGSTVYAKAGNCRRPASKGPPITRRHTAGQAASDPFVCAEASGCGYCSTSIE